jgi:hypothetical protein
VLEKQLGLLIDCIDVLLIKNRKNVSPNRVAAFIKRLILITFTLSARCTVAILALSRRLFIVRKISIIFILIISLFTFTLLLKAHPNLRVIFDKDEELIGSVYRPDCVDPDHCSVLSISLKVELFHLSRVTDLIFVYLKYYLLIASGQLGAYICQRDVSGNKRPKD